MGYIGDIYMYMNDDYSPLVLPIKYDEMDSFIRENKVKLTEQVVSSIQYALENKIPAVEVFLFKNTDFVVMLSESSFKSNIDSIFQFYIDEELYELCDRTNKVKELLSHEKKTKRTIKKGSKRVERRKSNRTSKKQT